MKQTERGRKMAVLDNIEPKEVFYYFEELSKIPRGTFHTKDVSDYCVRFAKEHSLEFIQDEWNNIIIKKPGTQGYEMSEPVIIQGHLDMVCEKTADSDHDFLKDPLDLYVEGGFVKAKDTTLGADDGIAIAMALAVLDSDTLEHPPIEALFTVDEEVGMTGAMNVDLSPLEGKMLLNLDSEDEGVLTAGCAGGFRFDLLLPLETRTVDGTLVELKICGLKGGHSGVEISCQRGNANKLAGRLLYHLQKEFAFSLKEINGGAKDNVIPSACRIEFVTDSPEKITSAAKQMLTVWKEEFLHDEPELDLEVHVGQNGRFQAMTSASQKKVLAFLVNCPNGVYEYSRSLDGLVETSDNLGVVSTDKEKMLFRFLIRSSVASKITEMKEKLINWCEMLGGTYLIESEYPAWMYKEESRIRPIAADAYAKVFGIRPEILTIHAGLECGLLSGKKPELDCISFGPQMYDIHSYHERLDIESTLKTWEVLKEILRQCK